MNKFQVRNISFNSNRVIINVYTEYTSSASFVNMLILRNPNIANHNCKSSKDLKDTSLAHIFEHLVIDYQQFGMGTTTSVAPNMYRVELSYKDDIECLRAINESKNLIEQLLDTSSFLQR